MKRTRAAGGHGGASGPVRELRLELLLGRQVVDTDGATVGRIEEVVAEIVNDECLVRAYLVGRYALLERLGGGRLASSLLRLLTRDRGYEGYIVPWSAMDLSDPEHPRATLRLHELPRSA